MRTSASRALSDWSIRLRLQLQNCIPIGGNINEREDSNLDRCDCDHLRRRRHCACDSLTENTQPHFFRNVGSVNARISVAYVIAKGQPRRIDQPAPPCSMALGLE